MTNLKNPVHPGEILSHEFLAFYRLSASDVAEALFLPESDVEHLISGSTAVTTDIAVRFSKLFGTSAEYWLNLQRSYDLSILTQDAQFASDLSKIAPYEPAFR